MRLTLYGDYSLRLLMYLALNHNRVTTLKEIADSYDISKNHLVKISNSLLGAGYVRSVRGRNGGLLLAKNASEIVVGDVIKLAQENFRFVECFDEATNSCCISGGCNLRPVLDEALAAFFKVLEKYTLADITRSQDLLRLQLKIGPIS